MRSILLIYVLPRALASALAELAMPSFFADHMVLQRAPLAARIWGQAAPSRNVGVRGCPSSICWAGCVEDAIWIQIYTTVHSSVKIVYNHIYGKS